MRLSKKDLLECIKNLEKRVAELERKNECLWEVAGFNKAKVEETIEHYVQEHIWYSNVENLEAYEKGSKVRVLVGELNQILDGKPQSDRTNPNQFHLGKQKAATAVKKKATKKSKKEVK